MKAFSKGLQEGKQKFLDYVNQMSLDGKKGFRQDVPARWNHALHMLESALFYQRALHFLELMDLNYKHYPTVAEWGKLEKIEKFLAVFYNTAFVFSDNNYPTANLFFPSISIVYVTLQEQSESEDEYVRKMAVQMLVKFEKYWSECNVVLGIAVILDPRYKLQFVDFLL